jgi:hypothetical protein
MYIYNERTGTMCASCGGYQADGLPIRDTYVDLGFDMHGIMYEPILPTEKSRIGIIAIHSDDDYSTFPIGGELAKRGYRTLCGKVGHPGGTLDVKMEEVGKAVRFLRAFPGIEKVILMGHSGGATLMSAYQAVAENGVEVFQGDNMLIKCSVKTPLPPADGLMTLDSNWGNGAMTLFSIDAAVEQEGNGVNLDPALDPFAPENGFDPAGSTYSDAFLAKYLRAQAKRNNAIVQAALERLQALESGSGAYVDDEPFAITGAAQFAPCNKLFPQDVRLLNHTKRPHPLLHQDGSETTEVIHCLRHPRGGRPMTPSIRTCEITTVRSYLTNRAVMAGEDYTITPDCALGIQWDNTYNCTPGNMKHIHVPLLVMGMTGSYEYLAAEVVYDNAASTDKRIAFVEGAGHNFDNQGRQEFGDTQKVVFDYVDRWLSAEGRF